MKKAISFLFCILFFLQAAAWGRQGHATIAAIAVRHLTPTTKAIIDRYLNGESIVMHVSWADDYRNSDLVDYAQFTDGKIKKELPAPHCFYVLADGTVPKSVFVDQKHYQNMVALLDAWITDLSRNHATMDPELRWREIVKIVHLIGDLHNPGHCRFLDMDGSLKYAIYNVIYSGKETTHHKLRDHQYFELVYPFSWSDNATLIDSWKDEQIAEVCKGDIFQWATESAAASRHIYDLKPGETVTSAMIVAERRFTEGQIRLAGYRLAKVLNDIFDTGRTR